VGGRLGVVFYLRIAGKMRLLLVSGPISAGRDLNMKTNASNSQENDGCDCLGEDTAAGRGSIADELLIETDCVRETVESDRDVASGAGSGAVPAIHSIMRSSRRLGRSLDGLTLMPSTAASICRTLVGEGDDGCDWVDVHESR
jgi:hypothetical protein